MNSNKIYTKALEVSTRMVSITQSRDLWLREVGWPLALSAPGGAGLNPAGLKREVLSTQCLCLLSLLGKNCQKPWIPVWVLHAWHRHEHVHAAPEPAWAHYWGNWKCLPRYPLPLSLLEGQWQKKVPCGGQDRTGQCDVTVGVGEGYEEWLFKRQA